MEINIKTKYDIGDCFIEYERMSIRRPFKIWVVQGIIFNCNNRYRYAVTEFDYPTDDYNYFSEPMLDGFDRIALDKVRAINDEFNTKIIGLANEGKESSGRG